MDVMKISLLTYSDNPNQKQVSLNSHSLLVLIVNENESLLYVSTKITGITLNIYIFLLIILFFLLYPTVIKIISEFKEKNYMY